MPLNAITDNTLPFVILAPRRIVGLLLLLFLSSAPAYAQEAFALVKIQEGTAQLNGREVRNAQLVKPGERLSLPQGAKVRVMLLGQGAEAHFSGPLELSLTPKEVKAKAQKVQREEIRVSESVGSRNPKAGVVVRASAPPVNVAPPPVSSITLYPELPPQLSPDGSGHHVLLLGRAPGQEQPLALRSSQEVELKIIDLDHSEPDFDIFGISFPPASVIPNELPLNQSLELGRNYQLQVTLSEGNGDPNKVYYADFRVPTPEESAALERLQKNASRGKPKRRIPALLELAETSLLLGQPHLALPAFEQLRKIKSSKTPDFQRNYELVHRALEMRLP